MPAERLSEDQVSDAFHSYLKSSLAQAKAERLLDLDVLSSAEADLMITGPALCLFFAALRCTTHPPSVPLPRTGKTAPPVDLSPLNCPSSFISFLQIWSRNVPAIQALAPEYQHDLARLICGLEPLAQPLESSLARIAAELRAVAIEISQRRTFQDRYAEDLQAAIDAGSGTDGRSRPKVKASFVPPPVYDPTPSPTASSVHSPKISSPSLPSTPVLSTSPLVPATHLQPPPTPVHSLPPAGFAIGRSRTPSPAPSSSSSLNPPSPSFLTDAPSIQLIRETLYASLADVLSTHAHIRRLLRRDPPRAYFASVALAILDVALTRTHALSSSSSGGGGTDGVGGFGGVVVTGVLGAQLTLAQCPRELRPFMAELGAIGRAAREMEEDDSLAAVEALQDAGANGDAIELPTPRLERVRRVLERGVGAEERRAERDEEDTDEEDLRNRERGGRRSVEGRAVAFANRINALALGMTKLRAFRERQNEVFKVLANVVS